MRDLRMRSSAGLARRLGLREPPRDARELPYHRPELRPRYPRRLGHSAMAAASRTPRQRVREKHKLLAPLVLRFGAEPQQAANWRKGAKAEVLIGSNLEDLYAEGMGVLHDRRIPGTKYNVDHLVVSGAGVFVSTPSTTRVLLNNERPPRRPSPLCAELPPDKTSRPHSVASLTGPDVLTDDRWIGVPIIPTLLFIGTDNFPRRQKHPFQFEDVYVLWGKALGKLVRQLGPLNPAEVSELERVLSLGCPRPDRQMRSQIHLGKEIHTD